MLAKVLIDTDGVKSILKTGELGIDKFSTDDGRVYVASKGTNRKLAFKDEAASNRYGTKNEIYTTTPLYPGELVYCIEDESFVYHSTTSNSWLYLLTDISLSRSGYGGGSAGTWLETWETTTSTPVFWNSNLWGNFVEGSSKGKWNIRSTATPSKHTGPDLAYSGSFYLYAETSGGGYEKTFELSTTNFNKLTNLDLWVSMNGRSIGTFTIYTITNGIRTVAYTITGDQGLAWFNVVLDLSLSNAEELLLEYKGSDGYRGDFGLDNITITSV